MEVVKGPEGPKAGAGSQRALRTANTQRLLQALRDSGPLTQTMLARATGLSTATVSNLVRSLVKAGTLMTSPTTSSGRRAVLVELADAPTDRIVAGIDIGRRHQRIIMATMAREIVAEGARALPLGHHAEESIEAAYRLFRTLLAEAGVPVTSVIACGVGIPGPIDSRTGKIGHSAILPEWVGIRLQDSLAQRFEIPVHVDNDANLGALAEVTWGPYADLDNLVFVKVGTGIGAGLVLDGRVFRGHIGITGELGHTAISDYGEMCRCGNRGCLETVASTQRMLSLLQSTLQSTAPGRVATMQDVIDGVRHGDPVALRVVEDAGLALGHVLGNVVNLLNPERVVIGGPVSPLGESFLDPLRRSLTRHASPAVGAATEVAMSTLGERAEALGAYAFAVQRSDVTAWGSLPHLTPSPRGGIRHSSTL